MKKVTEVCDICKHIRPIEENVYDKDYCHNCFEYLMRDVPQDIREDYMPEMALEVIKYDSIGYLHWDTDSNGMEEDLNEILNKYGIKATVINDDDSWTVGFNKV